MSGVKQTAEKSLHLLRGLPRVALNNIRDNPGSKQQVNIFVIGFHNIIKLMCFSF